MFQTLLAQVLNFWHMFITSPQLHMSFNIFGASPASASVPGYSVCHQAQMPDVPDPESLPDDSRVNLHHPLLHGFTTVGMLVEFHLDGFKSGSRVWDFSFEPYVWWWMLVVFHIRGIGCTKEIFRQK